MASNQKKNDRKKTMTRIVCLALAGVMILSTLVAALLSQIW